MPAAWPRAHRSSWRAPPLAPARSRLRQPWPRASPRSVSARGGLSAASSSTSGQRTRSAASSLTPSSERLVGTPIPSVASILSVRFSEEASRADAHSLSRAVFDAIFREHRGGRAGGGARAEAAGSRSVRPERQGGVHR